MKMQYTVILTCTLEQRKHAQLSRAQKPIGFADKSVNATVAHKSSESATNILLAADLVTSNATDQCTVGVLAMYFPQLICVLSHL